MKAFLLSIGAAGLVMTAVPAFAQQTDDSTTTTTTVTKDKPSTGAGIGIVGGAATGAVVGGPVGAVVGGVVGGIAGAAVDPPREVKTYVTTQTVAPVSYSGPIAVGDTLPDSVTVYDVPHYDRYSWTYINGQKLLIDHRTHKIVSVINE